MRRKAIFVSHVSDNRELRNQFRMKYEYGWSDRVEVKLVNSVDANNAT